MVWCCFHLLCFLRKGIDYRDEKVYNERGLKKGGNSVKFVIDHDFHIHSALSLCSNDPEQNTERILAYGKQNGMKRICLTDHYWDESVSGMEDFFFYRDQNTAYVRRSLPLPQSEECEFLFGCETDIAADGRIGISPERYDEFDFIIVPTTHMHLIPYTYPSDRTENMLRARDYVLRFESLLRADLPFRKTGLAHMTCCLIHKENRAYLDVLNMIPDQDFADLFAESAKLGLGIELNIARHELLDAEVRDTILRPYFIAKEKGCRFYLGSDAHHPNGLDGAMKRFHAMVDLLDLSEKDKFHIGK